MSELLELRGVSKSFPGVRALDGVDFTLGAGEIHALMGENGAGKSTLLKVLTGVYRRDAGTMTLNGRVIHPHSPLAAQHDGISMVYQEVNLIPRLSVAENIFLGRQPRRYGFLNWPAIKRGARTALERLSLDIDVTEPLHRYSLAVQQLVAFARALDFDCRVLVLDEPTSSLDGHEVEQLFAVMRSLRERGLGVIFVSHFLDQIYTIADRITVLRGGRQVGEFKTTELSRLDLIARMIGRDMAAFEAQQHPHTSDAPSDAPVTIVAAKKLGKRGSVEGLDLEIHRGEVVGLAGLLGSGRTEAARLLFGADAADSGAIEVDRQRVTHSTPRQAIANGFGFCPEDRREQAILPDLSIRENIVIALQSRRGWLRQIDASGQRSLADRYIAALNIATSDAEKPIRFLSGGNQQKAILARWLAAEPRVLILDEPTRGIDVAAKAEIEKLISDLSEQGLAILFISSELEEVVRSSHRAIVMRDFRKVGELAGKDVQVDRILQRIAADDSQPNEAH
jgi:simple sugar transport system ATP-binding protein